jgi:A/G-specific adenine glycosylase
VNAAALLDWYARHGREHLPWRQTRDAYPIVVSEFMLQQTQVDRVLPLYHAFLERFPSFSILASAEAADVVRSWRGLGYNSRATRLHHLAQTVVREYGGTLPSERDALLALPGIGPYTASAIRAFAFDLPDAALDTNIRRIVHRTAFGLEFPPQASARDIDARAQAIVPPDRGHDWNSAMMDLGATICTARAPKCLVCPLREDCAAAPIDATRLAALARTHSKRSPQASIPFEQTVRFVRGRIVDRLRDLGPSETISLLQLQHDLAEVVPRERLAEIPAIVDALVGDGIVHALDAGISLG